VAVVQQAFADVRADEARAAGDEKIHGPTLTMGRETVEDAGWFQTIAVSANQSPLRRGNDSRNLK
jgi:hypothetical protein